MSDRTILYIAALLFGIALGFLMAYRLVSARLRDRDRLWSERLKVLVREGIKREEDTLRKDAAERSGHVLSGRVLERFSPLMRDFPFDPHDAVWIGHPVDFIVFDGLSSERQGAAQLDRVILLEVKSGSGKLSKRQRRIKEVVEAGMVEWKVFRVPIKNPIEPLQDT